MLFIFSVLH
jgi:hypothetical protein